MFKGNEQSAYFVRFTLKSVGICAAYFVRGRLSTQVLQPSSFQLT